METNQRIFGLDLMRVMAMGMILTAQCLWILPQATAMVTQVASLFHMIGLEVFFVLSGFLLGSAMYRLLTDGNLNQQSISLFFKKRMIQILPMYYLVLGINFIIAAYIGYQMEDGWRYIVLLQNIAMPIPAFFSESWGLPIIFFAAMLFPIVLSAFNAVFKPKNKSAIFLIATVLLILVFLISKCIYNATTANTDVNGWYSDLKAVLIYRLDAVFIGVLCSWLMANVSFFRKAKWLFAFLGCTGIAFLFAGVGYFQLLIERQPFFWNVLYLPLTSMSIAFFLPILVEWKSNFAEKPIRFLSSITFAVYLVHFGIVLQLMKYYSPVIGTSKQWILFLTAYLIITFILGFLLNRFYQKLLFNRLLSKL